MKKIMTQEDMMKEKISYEDALKKLEHAVGEIENSDNSFEQIEEFVKQGTELLKYCKTLLNDYEKGITKLANFVE
ncbi:MAG: exodeoxyribonuclease VII small subunit [Bacteroidales bacterium]